MPIRVSLCEHEHVARRVVNLPTVARSSDRVITGTAGGWAERFGVDPTVVRVALALLTFIAGLGAILYCGMFLLSDAPASGRAVSAGTAVREPLDHRRDYAVAAATAAILVAARDLMGRLALRAGWGRRDVEFVHINEIAGDAETAAHLQTFDSVHGRWHRHGAAGRGCRGRGDRLVASRTCGRPRR